jgi:hypothetical protein
MQEQEFTMEVLWDLLSFLGLVAVGLMVFRGMVGTR